MAICTRAQVLQYLGLSDTASSEPAIVVQAVTPSGSSTVSQVGFGVSSNVLTVTPTVTSGPSITAATFDLTSASYDTLSELVTALNALPYLNAELAAADGTVPSTLLSFGGEPVAANTIETVTYTNPTTDGTVGLIDTLIPVVQAMFERYTGRVVDSASLDERYDGSGAETITLRTAPVTTVTAVSIIDASGTATTVESTDYYADLTAGVLYARRGVGYDGFRPDGWGDRPAINRMPLYHWPRGTKNVRVQYTGGYSSVPADLSNAAVRMVCDLVLDRRNNRMLASSSMDKRSITRASEEELVRTYFGPWRRGV